jgi:hypothetical protein
MTYDSMHPIGDLFLISLGDQKQDNTFKLSFVFTRHSTFLKEKDRMKDEDIKSQ